MSHRWMFRSWIPSALFLATACLLAQPSISMASADEVPRRADGKPDLSGTYDTATLTPLVRPARYGDRKELTEEEANALADHWQRNLEKDYEPSDPDREAPPAGGTDIYAPEFTGAAGKVGGYNAFYVDIGEGAFKVNGKWRTSILIAPNNGQMPERSELGKKIATETAAFRNENTGTAWWLEKNLDIGPYDDPETRPLAERCLLARSAAGPPSLPSMYNNIKRIVHTDEFVMINIEWMHDTRIIYLQGDDASDDDPRWLGHSVGRWEGDTLVVTTSNFREDSGIARPFVSRNVEERFTRVDQDTLLYRFTVDDPTYEEPFTGEYPWPITKHKMYEYACHEGNYALGGILRGARLLEGEFEAESVTKDD